MSNKIQTRPSGALALQMDEGELMQVLQSSLYPGASPASIKMVLGYCKATGLDPMQKPVHIVPMWDAKSSSMRDVVMPGIGLYRTQAARTGCAGVTEPEFGPDVSEVIGGTQITYPAWCRVTVKRRQASGAVDEFTAKELWKENYAVRGGKEKSIAPNAMWQKRPYGQIAKCAEAQALRKAFPEIGSEPTADEMAGKVLNEYDVDAGTGEITPAPKPAARPELPACPSERFAKNLPGWQKSINGGSNVADLLTMLQSKYTLTPEQIATVNGLRAAPADVTDATVKNDPPMTAAEQAAHDEFLAGMGNGK
jgi:phage recombination protein Bet